MTRGAPLVALVLLGCGGQTTEAKAPASGKSASFTCPVLRPPQGNEAALDVAALFGVDQALASRVQRMTSLLAELERSATSLDREARFVCSALARDLDPQATVVTPLPTQSHPCEVAAQRLSSLQRALPNGLSVRVGALSCGVDKRVLAQCAGECLTGRADVESLVECADAERCGLEFSLPDASPQCLTQCGARALREVRCNADVELDLGGADVLGPEKLLALRRDLPRLVALGTSLGPRAVALVEQVKQLVDELAASIDALTAEAKRARIDQKGVEGLLDRRLMSVAVLAGCVAPTLADTVRAGAALQGSVSQAVSLHAALRR